MSLPHLIYTDQTGRFLVRSENNYIMILCDYDANAIIGEHIPDRKTTTLQKAFLVLFNKIKLKFFKPSIIHLDNEISKDQLSLLEQKGLKVQLVPPHEHRQNLSERATQTYKNYFITGRSGIDPTFLLILWDTLMPQANITINLIWSSRINPKLSAHAQLFG